jgi:subtilisin family serine protease
MTPFSGNGPTIDGRFKPDICAPGDMVIGAISRRDAYNWQTSIWPDTTSTNGRYVRETGTSVSSPLVAGAIALLLEASPKLTVDSIKTLLKATAIKDKYSGDLSVPDNRWGVGKINVYGALAKLLGTTSSSVHGIIDHHSDVTLKVLSFGEKRFLSLQGLQTDIKIAFTVSIFDCAGHKLINFTGNRTGFLLPVKIAKGLYFAKVTYDGKTVTRVVPIY